MFFRAVVVNTLPPLFFVFRKSSAGAEDQPFARRRISKVVVTHNENLETFYDFHESLALPEKSGASFDDVFFDNDSFWSGSITWY